MTDKQKVFIAEYLINGFNGTQAAISAGYAVNSARSTACDLLTNPNIRKMVQEHVDSTLNAQKDVLKKKIVDKLSNTAFSESEEMRETDKLKATELLGKYMTMFTDKTETTLKTINGEGKEIGFNFVDAPKKNDPDTKEA